MTSYVDVDLSEEALQEDVELQEAVEKMLEKGAVAIITDVKNDVSGVYEQFKAFFEGLFPFIVYWSEDRNNFWADMQHSIIISVLFVIFFWFLSPWQDSSSSSRNHCHRKTRRGKHSLERSKSTSSIKTYSTNQQNNTLSRQNSGISGGEEMEEYPLEDEEESEVQKFTKRWPGIQKSSPYRCLVLPPGCKRVDKFSRETSDNFRKEHIAKKKNEK